MYLPKPGPGAYFTLISPWGAIPEYSSQFHSFRRVSCEIPAYPGFPFRIAYAVGSYIIRESPFFDNMPFYLSFEVRIEGKVVGEPFIINQRNQDECSGYLPGLYKGVGDKKAQWSALHHQQFQKAEMGVEGDDDMGARPLRVDVLVYRCSVQEGEKKKRVNLAIKHADILYDELYDSDIESEGEPSVLKKKKSRRLRKQEGWDTSILDPKFRLLNICEWWYRRPSLPIPLPLPLPDSHTIPGTEDLPVYSRGPKSSPIHTTNPPQEIKLDKKGTCRTNFQNRMETGSLSPLRNCSLPEYEEYIGDETVPKAFQKIPNWAQYSPIRESILENHWQTEMARTGEIMYSRKSPQDYQDGVTAPPARLRRLYVHLPMPPGWEQRRINNKLYYFDHNAGRVQSIDPRISTNTVAPTNPFPDTVSLQTIREKCKEYLNMKHKFPKKEEEEIFLTNLHKKFFYEILEAPGGGNARFQRSLDPNEYIGSWLQQNFPAADPPVVDILIDAKPNGYRAFKRQVVGKMLKSMGVVKVWVKNPLRNLRGVWEGLGQFFGNGSGGKAYDSDRDDREGMERQLPQNVCPSDGNDTQQ